MKLRTMILAAAALPTMALAQVFDTTGMRNGFTMIETEVGRAFTRHNIQGDVRDLSLNQMVEIANILDDGSIDSDQERKQRIEAAIRRN